MTLNRRHFLQGVTIATTVAVLSGVAKGDRYGSSCCSGPKADGAGAGHIPD